MLVIDASASIDVVFTLLHISTSGGQFQNLNDKFRKQNKSFLYAQGAPAAASLRFTIVSVRQRYNTKPSSGQFSNYKVDWVWSTAVSVHWKTDLVDDLSQEGVKVPVNSIAGRNHVQVGRQQVRVPYTTSPIWCSLQNSPSPYLVCRHYGASKNCEKSARSVPT